MPLISVIIPIFNAERHIRKCIESVLAQTYENFEIICIDDCSSDKTKDIVSSLRLTDKRIKLISNRTNLGASASRNRGIKEASGDYITFVDADDHISKNALECLMRCAAENNYPDFIRYNFNSTDKRHNNYLGSLRNRYVLLPKSNKLIINHFFFLFFFFFFFLIISVWNIWQKFASLNGRNS